MAMTLAELLAFLPDAVLIGCTGGFVAAVLQVVGA